MKRRASDDDVHAFMAAVFPLGPALATAALDERIVLQTATKLITDLRAERDSLYSQLTGTGNVTYLDRMAELVARAEKAEAERDRLAAASQKPEHTWQFYANGSFCTRCGTSIGSGQPCR